MTLHPSARLLSWAQLVERYLDHDAWFRQRVRKGLDQLDRGEFLTHEEVGAHIEQMLRS